MEDSFDQKNIEEQKIITKRELRVAGLNHTKHLVSIRNKSYSINIIFINYWLDCKLYKFLFQERLNRAGDNLLLK